MIKKTLYFGNPAYLSLRNRQLLLRLPEVEKAERLPSPFKQKAQRSIPVEDIGIMVLDNPNITVTHGLLTALMENNVALVSCDNRRLPFGLMLPMEGNTLLSETSQNQIESSLPLRKQLWQQTIKAKITNQATLLSRETGKEIGCMQAWAKEVKSGDADNMEARAAVYYWKNIFIDKKNFVRDREGSYPNNLLNYGYAILRATVARSLVGSGLLPVMGIHHHSKYNAYCLADDVMEPYRPFVDELVIRIMREDTAPQEDLTKELKAKLLSVPVLDVRIAGKRSPLMVAVSQTTASLARCFCNEARKIVYPEFV